MVRCKPYCLVTVLMNAFKFLIKFSNQGLPLFIPDKESGIDN